MFDAAIYTQRRKSLIDQLDGGIILLPGNNEAPMNYPGNTYKFRQDSCFLYYFGLDIDNLAGTIDIDSGEEIIFGNDREIDDVIWMGPDSPMKEKAEFSGVKSTRSMNKLKKYLSGAVSSGRKIHYLPTYRTDTKLQISELLGIDPSVVNDNVSAELLKAVIAQRSIKGAEEISELEKALDISYEMNTISMKMIKPGLYESEISGAVEGIALALGNGVSFPIIFSVHGETLHNHCHHNLMKEGDIAVLDSGAESLLHYASDITRTIPVSGKFTQKQKQVYEIVLNSQVSAIEMMKPGLNFRDIHFRAAEIIFNGLKELGLTKGNTEDAVNSGAHALFFPHGLGHMLGLDVHDMEGLGENLVGYNGETKRSEQFGLAYLRFAREMKPGHVLTVEPGIYFIPQLIDQWRSENKSNEFINFDKVEEYKSFGGIRIEDDILVTKNGSRVLGKPIPKTVDDLENACEAD